MIQLHGLTEYQKSICEMLWSCEGLDDVKFLLDYVLDESERNTALTLIEMMHMEALERDEGLDSVAPIVDKMLKNIMENSK